MGSCEIYTTSDWKLGYQISSITWHFQVRIVSNLSNAIKQEGVLQGSILSITPFRIKVNITAKELIQCIKGSLYVEGFAVSYWSQKISTPQKEICSNA